MYIHRVQFSSQWLGQYAHYSSWRSSIGIYTCKGLTRIASEKIKVPSSESEGVHNKQYNCPRTTPSYKVHAHVMVSVDGVVQYGSTPAPHSTNQIQRIFSHFFLLYVPIIYILYFTYILFYVHSCIQNTGPCTAYLCQWRESKMILFTTHMQCQCNTASCLQDGKTKYVSQTQVCVTNKCKHTLWLPHWTHTGPSLTTYVQYFSNTLVLL